MNDGRIHDEACDWIVRLDSGQLNGDERQAFVRWLNRSPENAEAYQAMSRLWARMDTLRLEVPEAFDQGARRPSVRRRPQTPWFFDYRAAVAASLGVVCLIIAIVLSTDPVRGASEARSFITPVDATHVFEAADGSRIEIGPQTVASLAYDARHRTMELTRGMVTLDIAHEVDRPFILGLGRHQVTVLGTRFEARSGETGVSVRVDEGRVRFSARPRPDDGASSPEGGGQLNGIDLFAGQVLVFDAESASMHIETFEEERWENR